MPIQPPSRRSFLTATGALFTAGLAASAARACRRRWIGHAKPTCPPAFVGLPALRVRQDVAKLSDWELASLRRGVAVMKARPASDPTSWSFQANIHGTLDAVTSPLFNTCQHGTLLFFAWHRGYLYFFERILRQAAGDTDLNLPYWDWTTAPVLPAPFRTPANSANSLYELGRAINDGSALPASVVVDDLSTALNTIPFPPSGHVGFSPSLEGSPHGVVHVLVGGLMGAVPTAANDPIFWLHHSNIDRLWNRWLNLGGGRVNPSDTAFLDTPYSYADADGSTVTVRVREILGSAQLGYCYDNVPNPAPPPQVARLAQPPGAEAPQPLRVASSLKEDQKAESKPLGLKPETVKLHVPEARAAALKAAAEGAPAAAPGKVLLQIEGLSLAEAPNFTYSVYLNLPSGEVSAERQKRHYVGSIDFFGKGDDKHAHGDKTFTQTFDVTAVIARLRESKDWKADDLSVTLRALTPTPPKGGEEALRKRTEESSQRAKISYKRVNLVVAPSGR